VTGSFKVIKTGILSQLTEVRFYDETVDHVKAEHPEIPIELPCVSTAVENAIVNPTHVESSYSNSYIYVDGGTTNASGDPLRVPVKGVSGNSGRVKTVYFASGNTTPNIIWKRGDNG
jgi:hypothetical protein